MLPLQDAATRTQQLDTISLLLVYSAMAVLTFAFFVFVFDVARRAGATAQADAARPARSRASARVGEPAVAVLEGSAPAATSDAAGAPKQRMLAIGFSLTILGWLVLLAGTVLRGIAAGRVPWANMYEFSLTATTVIVGVFIAASFWKDLRFLGVFITGLAIVSLGGATVNFYVVPVPLPPALQSYWLIIHVFVATLGMGFLGLGAGLSILQLLRRPAQKLAFIKQLPSAETLETLAYRVTIVGFIFWTFTLIAGAIWAEHAWGRYWGWDTKEVWTFIIWVIYAGYIHARATRGWRGTRSAILSLIGFGAIIFNYVIVNQFFTGLHTYSGL